MTDEELRALIGKATPGPVTWAPDISWIGHDHGVAFMRPAIGGMWVSISDYHAAPDLAKEVLDLRAALADAAASTAVHLDALERTETQRDQAIALCEKAQDQLIAETDKADDMRKSLLVADVEAKLEDARRDGYNLARSQAAEIGWHLVRYDVAIEKAGVK